MINIKKDYRTQTKRVCIFFAISFILIIGINIATYIVAGENVLEMFFKTKSYMPVELMDKNGECYSIDGYTITMESTLYDSKTGIGYCVMSLSKDGGKIEGQVVRDQLAYGGFGQNNRFSIGVEASSSITYERVGDIIYAYIFLEHTTSDNKDWGITLCDAYDNSDENPYGVDGVVYKFTLPESTQVVEYEINEDTTLYLSPLGGAVYSKHSSDNLYVCISVKKGKDIIFDAANDIGIEGYGVNTVIDEDGNSQVQHTFIFKDTLDINTITDINVIY